MPFLSSVRPRFASMLPSSRKSIDGSQRPDSHAASRWSSWPGLSSPCISSAATPRSNCIATRCTVINLVDLCAPSPLCQALALHYLTPPTHAMQLQVAMAMSGSETRQYHQTHITVGQVMFAIGPWFSHVSESRNACSLQRV